MWAAASESLVAPGSFTKQLEMASTPVDTMTQHPPWLLLRVWPQQQGLGSLPQRGERKSCSCSHQEAPGLCSLNLSPMCLLSKVPLFPHGSLLAFWVVFCPLFYLQACWRFVGIRSFLLKMFGLLSWAVRCQQPYSFWFGDLCPAGWLLSGLLAHSDMNPLGRDIGRFWAGERPVGTNGCWGCSRWSSGGLAAQWPGLSGSASLGTRLALSGRHVPTDIFCVWPGFLCHVLEAASSRLSVTFWRLASDTLSF